MGYYKLIKTIINILGLKKITINLVIKYHNFSDSIIINKSLLFILNF